MKLFISTILLTLPLITFSQYSIKECGQTPRVVKKTKYNQSQEEFEKSDKYIKYLNKFNNWKSCVDSLNNTRLYSSNLKFDENKNVIFDTILVVENKNRDALYSSAREWVASTFNSATDVLKMDDRVSGKLIAKGFTDITVETGIWPTIDKFHFTVKIYCKDNRYRVIWSDLQLQAYPSTYDYNPQKRSANYSLTNPYKEDGYTPQIVRASIKENIIKSIYSFNKSLEKIMSKSYSDDGTNDDW